MDFEGIKAGIGQAFDAVKEKASQVADAVSEEVSQATQKVEETVGEIAKSVQEVSVFSDNGAQAAPAAPVQQEAPQSVFEGQSESQTQYTGDEAAFSSKPQEISDNQEQTAPKTDKPADDGVLDSVTSFIGDKVSKAADFIDETLFSHADAASLDGREGTELAKEDKVSAYTDDKRIKEKDSKKYVEVQSWGVSDKGNDCLEGIIENNYDLKAMGIEYGSDEYYKLQDAVMSANPEIFGKDGIDSVIYDNDKINLPVFKALKQLNEEEQQAKKQAALNDAMKLEVENQEKVFKAMQKSGGLVDDIYSFFGGDSDEKQAIAAKKAALEKAKSGNEKDILDAYKLINADKDAGNGKKVSELSNEEIADLMKTESEKSFEAQKNVELIQSGKVVVNGEQITTDKFTLILAEQMKQSAKDVENAVDRQGKISTPIGFINNYLGIGTTEDDMKGQLKLQQQLLNELKECKDPKEYAAKFKQLTGKEFNNETIVKMLAYDQAGKEIPENSAKVPEGSIDLSEDVKNISGTKESLSLTRDKSQTIIDDYKQSQKNVKDGAIALPIAALSIGLAPFTGGLSLAAGAAIGAGASVGLNVIDSIYDSNGDGKIDFNYKFSEDAPRDAFMGALNGLTAGCGGKIIAGAKALSSPITNRLANTAVGKFVGNMTGRAASSAPVQRAANSALGSAIKTNATKLSEFSSRAALNAADDGALGGVYAEGQYLWDADNITWDGAKNAFKEGAEAGIIFGAGFRGIHSGAKSGYSKIRGQKENNITPTTPAKPTTQPTEISEQNTAPKVESEQQIVSENQAQTTDDLKALSKESITPVTPNEQQIFTTYKCSSEVEITFNNEGQKVLNYKDENGLGIAETIINDNERIVKGQLVDGSPYKDIFKDGKRIYSQENYPDGKFYKGYDDGNLSITENANQLVIKESAGGYSLEIKPIGNEVEIIQNGNYLPEGQNITMPDNIRQIYDKYFKPNSSNDVTIAPVASDNVASANSPYPLHSGSETPLPVSSAAPNELFPTITFPTVVSEAKINTASPITFPTFVPGSKINIVPEPEINIVPKTSTISEPIRNAEPQPQQNIQDAPTSNEPPKPAASEAPKTEEKTAPAPIEAPKPTTVTKTDSFGNPVTIKTFPNGNTETTTIHRNGTTTTEIKTKDDKLISKETKHKYGEINIETYNEKGELIGSKYTNPKDNFESYEYKNIDDGKKYKIDSRNGQIRNYIWEQGKWKQIYD